MPLAPPSSRDPLTTVETTILPSGANDSTRLNALLANPGHYVFGPGTFNLDAPLVGVGGTILDFDEATIFDCTALADASVALSFTGTEAANVNLTANAVLGATSIAVANGAEAAFAAGDYIRIGSTAKWTPNVTPDSSMDQRIGEIARVASTAAGVINLQDTLQDGYLTADTAFVSKLTLQQNIELRGKARFLGKGSGNVEGVLFDRCLNVSVNGLRLYSFDDAHIVLSDAIDALIDDIHVEGGTSIQPTFYGVECRFACQDIVVRDGHFESCRHAFTCGGSTSRSGINRRILVRGCYSLNATAAGFDSHAGCDGITFETCTALDSVGAAFQTRCPRATIVGCVGIRPGDYGIYLRNQSDRSTSYTVVGCTIRSGATSGINYRTPSEAVLAGTTAGNSVDAVSIEGCTIVDPGAVAIVCQSAAGFPNLVGPMLVGNRVRWTSLSAFVGLSFVRITDGVMQGNVVVNAATGMQLDNSCATCSHGGNVFTTCTTRRVLGTGADHIGDAPDVVTSSGYPILRSGTAVFPSANQAQYYRVLGRGRLTSIGIHVLTQSGNIDVGVYRNAGAGPAAVPGARIGSSGSVACPAPGYAAVALTAAAEVEPGDWIAISCDNAVAAFSIAIGNVQTSAVANGLRYTQAAAFPLPNPAASLVAAAGNVFLLSGV